MKCKGEFPFSIFFTEKIKAHLLLLSFTQNLEQTNHLWPAEQNKLYKVSIHVHVIGTEQNRVENSTNYISAYVHLPVLMQKN